MSKAVIFDMGGILLDFPMLELTAAYSDTPEDARLLDQAIFKSPEWVALDRRSRSSPPPGSGCRRGCTGLRPG